MDQLPRSNEGFANNNMFADSQQYNAYDNLFQPGADQSSYDAGWGINTSAYPSQSRAPQSSAQAWPQNANHLSAAQPHASQASPYARSLSQSPAPYGQNHFNNYGAPNNFQYRQPQYDPTLVSPHAYGQAFNYATTNYQTPNAVTIAPHALEHETRQPTYNRSPYPSDYPMGNTPQARQVRPIVPETVDQVALASAIPNSRPAGYFSIINFDDLAKSTKSERMGNFVNVGIEAQNWDVNRAALPAYVSRKSRNDLRKLAGNDQKALAKIGKKSMKKERSLAPTTKPTQLATSHASPTAEKIKYEDSSSDEESSSDEDSDTEYSSDDAAEPTPLPAKRPETPREATEYDTMKALWRGKRKTLSSESIRKGIVDFWEIVKTIRDRWKADSTAVTEAEDKKRENELPLLKSRVKDQRDMMESAFKAALKHGHREIIGLLSENASLLYVCYQFLLDRHKVEDYNGSLSRVILETMNLFTTLSDEKLDKTHLVKLFPRFSKKGDAKTQGYVKRILSNAASGSKAQTADASKRESSKNGNAASPVVKRAEPEPVAGVKRAASTASEGGSQKKLATTAAKTSSTLSTIKSGAATKKASSTVDSTKGSVPAVTKAKPVTAKPSGMFSSLQSASKKPGTSIANKTGPGGTATTKPNEKPATTVARSAAPKSTFSFTETMANLSKPKEEKPAPKPDKEIKNETPEEKAKRLKKESRRSLRVQFKTGDELVEVRLFHHDPEEEIGHDASQMRDVSDVGGEGRMFKQQHQMMDLDEDEDAAEEEEKLMEFKTPQEIDFSDVDQEERDRNYAPFGGGKLTMESAERPIRDYYEANNLIVFYTDPSDIPPNPREPSDPTNGEKVDAVKDFAKPEEKDKWAARARQKKGGPMQYYGGGQSAFNTNAPNMPPGIDLSRLSSLMNTQTQQPPAYQQPQQPNQVPTNEAITDILAKLQQSGFQQTTPAPPQVGSYNAYAPPPPNMNVQPQQSAPAPAGQPDLAAILAAISGGQNAATQAPPMGGYSYNAAAAMPPNMMGYGGQQGQQPAVYENPERKQWREGGNGQRQKTGPNPYYKTKVCKYWQVNACQKGDSCTYKHEE